MYFPKISIIVPVYRAETYLDDCVSQLRKQYYPNIEIVLVDDGSPDRSGVMCDDYASKDERICVVHKPNGGASDARNAGIDKASGELICFVDSDDVILSDYISDLYSDFCKNTHADLVIQGFIQKWDDREHTFSPAIGVYDITEGGLDILFEKVFLNDYSGPYCKLFRKCIIDEYHIRFSTEIIYAEDFDFLLRYIPHARVIVSGSATNYIYLMHDGSVSSKIYSFEKELSAIRRLGEAFSLLSSYCHSKAFAYSMGISLSNYVRRLISSNYSYKYPRKTRIDNLSNIDNSLVEIFDEFGIKGSKLMKITSKLLLRKRYSLLDKILYFRLVII